VRYWITDLKSRAQVSSQLLEGTEFDVKNELGLSDRNFPEIRFAGRLTESNKIRLEYFQVDYSGDKNITRTINFAGQDFVVNTRVVSDFDLKQLRAAYAWQFIKGDKVRVGPLVEVRGIWLDTMLDAPDEATGERRDFGVALPAFGADLDAHPHEKVQIFASVAGIPSNRFGHLIDADFGVKVFPFKNVGVSAGYRFFDLKGKDDDDFATVRISGLTVGAAFRF
ncbi:MAG TPA: hypothetical protein VJZ26_07315, partial [Blastocatellia bacterium]|nr:hypothetical protein [Blastocatellia bacterium]